MNTHSRLYMKALRLLGGVALITAHCSALGADNPHQFKADPTKVLGRETCVECHEPMVKAWEKTHHFLSFQAGFNGNPPMHRTDSAKAILKKMDVRSAKRGVCVECHYTGQASSSERVRTISGTSCESCHGGAKDWVKIHSDSKNNPNALTDAQALGMIRPHQTYAVAANCFGCHTVPNEELVNVGGHTAGSDFELVAWTQGEMRHNLQESEGKQNPAASAERQVEMFAMGKVLDLEYGIRGLATATKDGKYSQSMISRVNAAQKALADIVSKTSEPSLTKIAGFVNNGDLKHNNAAALTAAADSIRKEGLVLQESGALKKLSALSAALPSAADYKGKVYTP